MKKKSVKLKKKNLFFIVVFLLIVGGVIVYFLKPNVPLKLDVLESKEKTKETITDFENITYTKAIDYAEKQNLEVKASYDYSDTIEKDKIISGNIEENVLNIVVSLGSIPLDEFKEKQVNELGNVPIMMYHGIVNTTDNKYTGGNVDKDGYNRTSKAFSEDLEMYYKKGYRMIRLKDYIDGKIDVEMGYSPIILTFDDGNENNFKVIKKNEDGTLVFDENSAIGILEKFKKEHEGANVTATFFLTGDLCNQKEYNEDIMKWLVDNGYDIGNHTISHIDFTKINIEKTKYQVGALYQKLENIIPGKYVNIIALPFGSPYKKSHSNYQYILNGEYEGVEYHTEAALRVGWEAEVSPFNKTFDKTFLKRIRAYDNKGVEFDIEMNFKTLEKNRFISDGSMDLVTIPKNLEEKLGETNLKVVTY
ncbi:MAG: polysaccharide deacetylase family protein [Bacilli bacterium]|nr:polysaccharide deacetylase family protein [Bacilli bacterium]